MDLTLRRSPLQSSFAPPSLLAAAVALVAGAGCSATPEAPPLAAAISPPPDEADDLRPCSGVACDGTIATSCGASGEAVSTDCAADGRLCVPGLGCAVCVPGEGASCSDGKAVACRHDGSGTFAFECDSTQGMSCEPDGCKGACSPAELGPSYVGCDYRPTVTLNTGLYWSGFPFAVGVASASPDPANVVVTRGEATIATFVLAPSTLEVVELPWIDALRGPEPTLGSPQAPPAPTVVEDGAYRLRSDRPVTVYQFNPLTYETSPAPSDCPSIASQPGCFSFSNDASLLLPAHALRTEYMAVAWETLGCRTGFVSVTAIEDGTVVELDARGEIEPGAGLDASGNGSVVLGAGDVVQVTSRSTGGPFCFVAPGSDVTGTRVLASKPVQVIAGHACANVPAPETQACDHLEEAMFPVETLGRDHLATVPALPGGGVAPATLRVVAAHDDTTISFDPPVHETVTLDRGAFVHASYVDEDVRITSDRPVIVAQFMQGSDSTAERGDPSQSLVVPTEQFRTEYVFLAPATYDESFVNVVAPAGAEIVLDGEVVPASAFSPIGDGGAGVARVALSQAAVHRAQGSHPFGITVYAYGTYTSYMLPGGLDLGTVSVAPPK